MKILIAGASGLIGRATAAALRHDGHEVLCLVRRAAASPGEVSWNPAAGEVPLDACRTAQAVVNLCGADVAGGRWTQRRRDEIRASRIDTTRTLAKVFSGTISDGPRPGLLVNASAIGFYGNRGNFKVDEASGQGSGFLADLCRDWEAAAMAVADLGARVACVRFGIVLSREGGLLRKIAPYYRAGLGGPLGTGRQWMSWIELEDAVGVIRFAIGQDWLSGPVNAVSPAPVLHAAFSRTLGQIFGRQLSMPIPPFLLRLALGQMADETILSSAHVLPTKLMSSGYPFRYNNLEDALNQALAAEKSEG
jgi:uncharacterized protein (TIGR01777 family)